MTEAAAPSIIERARAAREEAAAQPALRQASLREIAASNEQSSIEPSSLDRGAAPSIIERARVAREAAAAQLEALREQTSLRDIATSEPSSVELEVESILTRVRKVAEEAAMKVPDVLQAPIQVQVQASDNHVLNLSGVEELSVSSEDSGAEALSTQILRDRARKARVAAAAQLHELELAEEKNMALQSELEKRRVSLELKRAKRQWKAEEAKLAETGLPPVVLA